MRLRSSVPAELLAKLQHARVPLAVGVTIFIIHRLRRRKQQSGRVDTSQQQSSSVPEGSEAEDVGDQSTWQGRQGAAAAGQVEQVEPLGTVLLQQRLDIGVKQLWLATMCDSQFAREFQRQRGYRDVKRGHWHRAAPGADGQLERRLEYITPVKKNRLGPKEAWCFEQQVCTARGAAGFVVTLEAHTPKVPYGGNFYCKLQWVAKRLSSSSTQLSVTAAVVFTKGCLVKGIIDKASMEGMRESYQLYQAHLSSHLPQLAKSVPLAGSGAGAEGHRRGAHSSAIAGQGRQKVSAIATDAASLLGALAQWVVLLMLILLVYCWWHRAEVYWGLPGNLMQPLLDRLASLQEYQLQASRRSGWVRRPWKYNSI